MVRNYKRKAEARNYRTTYTSDDLAKAVEAVKSGQMKLKPAARHFKIPARTLHNKVHGAHEKTVTSCKIEIKKSQEGKTCYR